MVYFHGVNSSDSVITKKANDDKETKVSAQQETVVVPVGKREEKKSQEADKLPQGFYVEKTTEDTKAVESKPDNDEDETDLPPDTKVDTSKLETAPGIALSKSEPIDDAIEAASMRGLGHTLDTENKLDKAQTMIKDDQNSLIKEDFEKGIHGIGVVRVEKSQYNVKTSYMDATRKLDTGRADAILTYENKSGNTKLMFSGTYTNTRRNVQAINPAQKDSELNDSQKAEQSIAENTDNLKEYGVYFAIEQKIGEKDKLDASIVHAKGGILETLKTTSVAGEYACDKYNFTLTGTANKTNVGTASSFKTNLSFKFNSIEDKTSEEVNTEATKENQQEETQKQPEVKTEDKNNKKWQSKGGLIIDIDNYDGEAEQGIGYYRDFKKKNQKTYTKFSTFAKGSMTSRKDEPDSYYATAGVEFKYKNKINEKTKFETTAQVVNKYAFTGNDKGNTFTGKFKSTLSNSKVNAEVEGKYVAVPNSKYAAISGKVSYKPSKKFKELELFARGDYTYENKKDVSMETKGYSILGGVSYSF